MKLVYIVETYTEGLGYIDNVLPIELARLGVDVHIVTCRLPPYYQNSMAFFGSLLEKRTCSSETNNSGVTIHTMPYTSVFGRVFIKGFLRVLKDIDPDVVIVRGISSPVLGQAAIAKILLRYKLFTSTGQAYSAISRAVSRGGFFSRARLANFFSRYLLGRILSLFVSQCIASSEDGGDAVVEFYGVPRRKVTVISLGVDTEKFFPVSDGKHLIERNKVRNRLGIPMHDIVCIWTGRMTGHKYLRVLAEAVEDLNREGHAFTALFVGDGPEAKDLEGYSKSIHIPFMLWVELPPIYRAADIAVWPRSITTSTLDASASGLPVIMSEGERATERWQGIGSAYIEGSVESLKKELLKFLEEDVRRTTGQAAAAKMKSQYSWTTISKKFLNLFSIFDLS